MVERGALVVSRRTPCRYTANVTVNGKPDTVVLYASHVVPDGHTLWFYDDHRLVGSIPAQEVRSLLRDADDRCDNDIEPFIAT